MLVTLRWATPWILVLATSVAMANESAPLKNDQIHFQGLSREQARQVLVVVLKHEGYRLGKAGVFIDGDLADEKGNPPHPGYFDFSLGYDNPRAGAIEYWGLFSVSTLTGDVWETNICKRFAFPALRRIQRLIMARTGKSMADESQQLQGLGCPE